MNVYRVTDPDSGVTLKLRGDSPPTEAELEEIFAQHQPPAPERYTPPLNAFEGFLVDMGRGFTDVGQGAKSLAMDAGAKLGMVDQEKADIYRQSVADEIAEFEGTRGSGGVGRFAGQLAGTAWIPGGVAGGAGRRALTSALAGGVVGAGMPTDADGGGRVVNAITGAVGGGAGSALISGAGKGINALRGRIKPEYQEIVGLSDQFGVPASYSDVTGGAFSGKAETALESVPVVGTSKFRAVQNKASRESALELVRKFKHGDDSVGDAIQDSANQSLQYYRSVGGRAFNELRDRADPMGDIPLPRLNKAVDESIAKYQKLIEANPQRADVWEPYVRMLQKHKDLNLEYSGVRDVRANLDDEIASLMPASQAVGNRKVPMVQELKDALDADLDRFFDDVGGELSEDYRLAKDFWRENVIPFKSKAQGGKNLNQVVQTDEPDRLLRQWVFGDKKDKAATLYQSLTPRGRQSVKYGVLDEAFQKAASGPNSDFGAFSPAKWAQEIDKYQDAIPTFFTPDERKMVDGFTKLMRHTKRSGQFAENPPTGNRLVPLLLAGGAGASAFADPVATLGGAAVVGTISQLFTSKAGRNLLLSASREALDSKQMTTLARQFYRMIPRAASVGTPSAFGDSSAARRSESQ